MATYTLYATTKGLGARVYVFEVVAAYVTDALGEVEAMMTAAGFRPAVDYNVAVEDPPNRYVDHQLLLNATDAAAARDYAAYHSVA